MIGKGNSGLMYSMEQLPKHWDKYYKMLTEYKKADKNRKSLLYEKLDLKACEILVVQRRVSSQFPDKRKKLVTAVDEKKGSKDQQLRNEKYLKHLDTLANNIGM